MLTGGGGNSRAAHFVSTQLPIRRLPIAIVVIAGGRARQRERATESIRRARRDREARLADSDAMRERPELRSAFISLRIAEQFAERNIRDARDRALFVERVKAVMALSVKTSAPAQASPTRRREDPTR